MLDALVTDENKNLDRILVEKTSKFIFNNVGDNFKDMKSVI